ncbi:type II toxin-antitoxin system RelE/ParE family toxin [Streptomyces sp. PT12]|uniref:type II toxin-antitoxin system RelE family toxin n=1 Tax=Streptomyces sp. PT12 TaxID=1510197 RepID=UPI000DE1CEDD|nr:type II toxin-antitoxin system RelE/ParE family toxin [Streptomyces sp. PT12]RBM21382.1 plasmid stabilization protein [Streptomyces sp. PT12]
MSHEIIWEEAALNSAAGFLKTDPDELAQLLVSVDALADDPRPQGSFPYGSEALRRMRVGRFRVLYEVVDSTVTILILHLGRTP